MCIKQVAVVCVAICAVLGSIGLTTPRAAQTDRKSVGPISLALTEPVTRVVIHQVIFSGPVTLKSVKPLGSEKVTADRSLPLKSVGTGIMISRGLRASRLQTGDRISPGDTIVGGVVQNNAGRALVMEFAGHGHVILEPGQNLYVGSMQRLMGNFDFEVGGASAWPAKGVTPPHSSQCSGVCDLDGEEDCAVTFATDNRSWDQCPTANGSGCLCKTGGTPGVLKESTRVFVPGSIGTQ